MQKCCSRKGRSTLGKGFTVDDDAACGTVSIRDQYMPHKILTVRAGFETVLIRPRA